MASRLSKAEKEQERQLQQITRLFEKNGVRVRREKLSRGHAFRVKSGDCLFSGRKLVFVDRRLPTTQQMAVLLDYLVELGLRVENEDIQELPSSTQALLGARLSGNSSSS